jgi:transposase
MPHVGIFWVVQTRQSETAHRRLSAGPGRAVRRLSHLRPRPLRNLGALAPPRQDSGSRPARPCAVLRIRGLAARPHRLRPGARSIHPVRRSQAPDTSIGSLLPGRKRRGPRRVDDRRVISGIIHVLQSGMRWRDCPEEYGPPTTIYNRWHRWSQQGLWQRMFKELSQIVGTRLEAADAIASNSNLPASLGLRPGSRIEPASRRSAARRSGRLDEVAPGRIRSQRAKT